MVVYRVIDPHRRGGGGQVAIAPLGRPPRNARSRRSAATASTSPPAGPGSAWRAVVVSRPATRRSCSGPTSGSATRIAVDGIPSRARVSPDGRYGAVTLFVTGDSYADAGSFSTRTTIIDLAHGRAVAKLEDFMVFRGRSRRVTAIDVNFWGITFARDSDRFYATMATGGKTYLIEGSVRAARGARHPRERRVPVAVARRHADCLQAPHGLRRDSVAADGPRSCDRPGDSAG